MFTPNQITFSSGNQTTKAASNGAQEMILSANVIPHGGAGYPETNAGVLRPPVNKVIGGIIQSTERGAG
jgi:hypothetical protein